MIAQRGDIGQSNVLTLVTAWVSTRALNGGDLFCIAHSTLLRQLPSSFLANMGEMFQTLEFKLNGSEFFTR